MFFTTFKLQATSLIGLDSYLLLVEPKVFQSGLKIQSVFLQIRQVLDERKLILSWCWKKRTNWHIYLLLSEVPISVREIIPRLVRQIIYVVQSLAPYSNHVHRLRFVLFTQSGDKRVFNRGFLEADLFLENYRGVQVGIHQFRDEILRVFSCE